jgi:hypothetical protein
MRVVTLPPHTTQIIHVFDLILFGVLKKRDQSQLPRGDGAGSGHATSKAHHDFPSGMIDTNEWGAFQGNGVPESEGVTEFSHIHFPLGKPSLKSYPSKLG